MRSMFLMLSLFLPVTVLSSTASLAQSKLDSSILSYDGKNFVRTETTLMNNGQSAVNTKLEPDSPAYKALAEGHSYTGPVTVFGKTTKATTHRSSVQTARCPALCLWACQNNHAPQGCSRT